MEQNSSNASKERVEAGPFQPNSINIWADSKWVLAIQGILTLLLIIFGNPLFRTLGFEYSATIAMVLSLTIGLHCAAKSKNKSLSALAIQSLFLFLIPLTLGLVSAIVIPNCALWDGCVFYLAIVFPTAFLAWLFGIMAGRIFHTPRISMLAFLSFWFISFFLSLLPGYLNPQLYTYGWQYGYFPGLVWDEALELSNAYYWSRLEIFAFAIALLLLVPNLHERGVSRAIWSVRRARYALGVLFLILSFGIFSNRDKLHITCSHARVETILTARLTVGRVHLYYAPNTFTHEALEQLQGDVLWYTYNISDRYLLRDTLSTARIYIYPNTDAMKEYIGTEEASIAKPWLGELHIAKQNLGSLKHELTHVLLREYGRFPFYTSWSVGLTEGAAMAVEPSYDGLYTLDQHASRILQLHLATGVSDVMSFTGFASNASQKSYVLAGSFTRFLIRAYGANAFVKVYRSLSYPDAYGKPFSALEQEWKQSLVPFQTALDRWDSLKYRYYYDRPAIFYAPCLRRIGKWRKEAADRMKKNDYPGADSLYQLIIREDGSVHSVADRSEALLNEGKLPEAVSTLLDAVQKDPVKAAGRNLYIGDLLFANREDSLAQYYYDLSGSLKISDQFFMASYERSILARTPLIREAYRKAIYYTKFSQKNAFTFVRSAMDTLFAERERLQQRRGEGWDSIRRPWLVLLGLQVRQDLQRGKLQSADSLAQEALGFLYYVNDKLSGDDSLYLRSLLLMTRLPVRDEYPFLPTRYREAAYEQYREIMEEKHYLKSLRR